MEIFLVLLVVCLFFGGLERLRQWDEDRAWRKRTERNDYDGY